MKKIAVLGCTGSIGLNTLEIIRAMPERFEASFIVAHKSADKIKKLADEFHCPFALTSSEPDCIKRLIDENKPDIVVNGIAGSAGLLPSKIVLETGCDLALANKETVVMAWNLISDLAAKTGAKIVPVDSEHSALFNLTEKIGKKNISELIVTASGGPFRNYSKEQLASVTVEQALNHPTWKMGKKITIDSASLANKGLEVIEAVRLFGFAPENVKVLVHPESVVHSLVRTRDGMLYAQLSDPDMKHPIFGALVWPEYEEFNFKPFDLTGKTLSFFEADAEKFPMLALAYKAAKLGAGYTIAYNAANEIAVAEFLAGKISFTDIPRIVGEVMERDWSLLPQTFDEVFKIDSESRKFALETVEKL